MHDGAYSYCMRLYDTYDFQAKIAKKSQSQLHDRLEKDVNKYYTKNEVAIE